LNWLTALILGIVQGLTELLPVSSSGHLVLMEKLMGVHLKDVSFEISVHVATALALCFVLRRELWLMLRSVLPNGRAELRGAQVGKTRVEGSQAGLSKVETAVDERRKGRLLILAVIIGSIPAGLLGVGAQSHIEAAFHGAKLTLAMLPVTGVFLILTRWAKDKSGSVSVFRSFIVGVAQAIAILPGISRSGLTVGTGLFLGIAKEEAVRFSFLLSIPAIGGAALLKLMKGSGIGAGVGAQNLAIATVVAFFSALVAARALLGVVRRGKLNYFGYYCLAVGVLGLLFLAR
jgi:undecaprenyl-diphosphatase